MELVRKIEVNNKGIRVIYKDKEGNYFCYLEDENGVRDKDDFWHYIISASNYIKLLDDYVKGIIPRDFWSDRYYLKDKYEVVENPLECAFDGDVIMLLNWYRYRYC